MSYFAKTVDSVGIAVRTVTRKETDIKTNIVTFKKSVDRLLIVAGTVHALNVTGAVVEKKMSGKTKKRSCTVVLAGAKIVLLLMGDDVAGVESETIRVEEMADGTKRHTIPTTTSYWREAMRA